MDFSLIFGYPLGWVMWLFYQVIKNYGVAILLFTLFTRVLLYPLGIKQQKSSARMAFIQPKIQALQKKYKNNKQKLQEETMKLYEEEGYNPMSGCFPLLIQLPILFGLINVIYNPLTHMLRLPQEAINAAVEIAKGLEGFNQTAPQLSVISFIQNGVGDFSSLETGVIEAIKNFDLNFLGVNLGAQATYDWNWLLLIPILSGLTAVLSSIVAMKFNPASQISGQQMGGAGKGMMFMMPLLSFFIAFSVPVGVVIYWIMSNILMGVQSFILYKVYTPEKMEKLLAKDNDKKKGKKKPSRYQQALKQSQGAKKPELVEDENGMVTYKGEVMTKKEANRRRLAEARRRDAEKYGEVYKEVTDDDLR